MIVQYKEIINYSEKAYKIKFDNGKELFVPKANVINYNKVTKNIQLQDWYYEKIKNKI